MQGSLTKSRNQDFHPVRYVFSAASTEKAKETLRTVLAILTDPRSRVPKLGPPNPNENQNYIKAVIVTLVSF